MAATVLERIQKSFQTIGNRRGRGVNLAPYEQRASLFGGLALAAYGLSRRSLRGLLVAALGLAFVRRGLTGHSAAYRALGIDRT
jgi:uncharacterized membrane protein